MVHDYLHLPGFTDELFTGLISFHPVIFYWAALYMVTSMYQFRVIYQVRLTFSNLLLLLSFVALFSGGYWGYLQLNWGSWWTWDVIDFSLLLFLLVCVRNMHDYYHFVKKSTITAILTIFTIIFFIRIGLVNSKHTFFNVEYVTFNFNSKFKLALFLFAISSTFIQKAVEQPWSNVSIVSLPQLFLHSVVNLTLLLLFTFLLIDWIYEHSSLFMLFVSLLSISTVLGRRVVSINLKNKKLVYHILSFLLIITIMLTAEAHPRFYFLYDIIQFDLTKLQVYANQMVIQDISTNFIHYFDFTIIWSCLCFEYYFEDLVQHEFVLESHIDPTTLMTTTYNLSDTKSSNSVVFDFLGNFLFGFVINAVIFYSFLLLIN